MNSGDSSASLTPSSVFLTIVERWVARLLKRHQCEGWMHLFGTQKTDI